MQLQIIVYVIRPYTSALRVSHPAFPLNTLPNSSAGDICDLLPPDWQCLSTVFCLDLLSFVLARLLSSSSPLLLIPLPRPLSSSLFLAPSPHPSFSPLLPTHSCRTASHHRGHLTVLPRPKGTARTVHQGTERTCSSQLPLHVTLPASCSSPLSADNSAEPVGSLLCGVQMLWELWLYRFE